MYVYCVCVCLCVCLCVRERVRAFVDSAPNSLILETPRQQCTMQVIGDETCACIASWSNNVPMVAIRLPDKRRCHEFLEPLNGPMFKLRLPDKGQKYHAQPLGHPTTHCEIGTQPPYSRLRD